MIGRLNVEARSKGRMSIKVDATIITEPGTLTKAELACLKTEFADQLMIALAGLRYLNVSISDMKVKK